MKRHVHQARPTDSLRAIAQKMREEDIGFMPVCDEHGKVLGVITDRDIVVRACADDRTMSATRAEAILSPNVIACRPTHGIGHAEALMRKHRRSRIVVTDAFGVLAGVISLSDIAQYQPVDETFTEVASRKYTQG